MFSKISNILDYCIDILKIPGNDLIIYHNGTCVFREQRGFSDYDSKVKMNGSERFNLYSASKIITCTAAMTLWEKGAFKLDDPLHLYMPEFKDMLVTVGEKEVKAKNEILVKNLFTMSAGFDYNTEAPEIKLANEKTDGKCPTRETVKYLAQRPLSFEPGAKWQYSLCHDVLAAFVETVSGMRFSEYVKENVFKAADMKNSTYMLPNEELGSLMAQYLYKQDTKTYESIGTKIRQFKLGEDYESGGAGCVSTAEDYIKFLEALRLGKIVSSETLDFMSKNHLTEQQTKSYHLAIPTLSDFGYGLGFFCTANEGGVKSSFGGTGAGGAAYYVNQNLNYSMFYAQHVFTSPFGDTWQKIKNHLNEIFA